MTGVGYTPPRTVSKYKLDTLESPWRSHPMDMSADPGAVGASPNPHYLNLADPAVADAYCRRYGSDILSKDANGANRFKTFEGGGNETMLSVWGPAITWAHGIARPTIVEMTDALATNDVAMVRGYLVAEVDGYSPGRVVHINDPSRPHGALVDPSFWGIPLYLYNDAEQVEPPIDPPPVDDDPPVDPPVDPPHVCPPAWPRLGASVLSDAAKLLEWPDLVVGRGRIKGAKALARRILDHDAKWVAAHPGRTS